MSYTFFCAACRMRSASAAHAACVDNVVLVHGNAGRPADFDNTYGELIRRGYTAGQIFRPDWGSKVCPACNDHSGSEEMPVERAIIDAIATSCTGRIDVIGHSMGATLSARVIDRIAARGYVDAFVGIAGAGMSALAELFVRRGAAVTGCDAHPDAATRVARAQP